MTTSAQWDLFISHASEDKGFTDELSVALTRRRVRVWYDKSVLTLGDSLREKIDEGLAGSRFGVVVLSKAFFGKRWPRTELDGLFSRQMSDGRKRILPIWHNVTEEDVADYSPIIVSLLAANTNASVEDIVGQILSAIDWPNGRVDQEQSGEGHGVHQPIVSTTTDMTRRFAVERSSFDKYEE